MAMQVMMDRALVRAGVTSTRHVLARITAPTAAKPTQLAEATEANRARDFTRARRALEGTRRRIVQYANNDPQLNAVVQDLELDEVSFCRAMEAPELKASYFAADVARRSRNRDGTARR